ncbi:unnamed protein product [Closterium sp. NIES-54]
MSGLLSVGRLGVVAGARMSGVAIFDLDYDAILVAMYALSVTAEGDCYLCVSPDPGIEAAALGASESSLPGTAPADALHTITLDSGASRCFFRDSTTLTPLPVPVPVRLADPSGGPLVARSSTVLPCPVVPSSSLSSLHLPSFSMNLVSTAALQDAMVTTTTPGGQRVSICTCQVAPPCSCRLLSHQTLLWHHRLGHPSLPCLRGMHSRLLGRERYFLLVVDDYTRYTTIFPLRSKGQVVDVLIPWIRAVRLKLRERFCADVPVPRLHSDRGGEFSSDLLREFCHGEGILKSFMLPDSPQKNGIAERRIGLVMEVARTSMIHAATPHFLWPFAVRYAAHQLNLWPRVSLPETLPTLRWTGKVGNASVFWRPAPSAPCPTFTVATAAATASATAAALLRAAQLWLRFGFSRLIMRADRFSLTRATTAPPATADSSTRSQWLTRDTAARLAIRNHLPLAECAHFGRHRTAQALYDTVVARYSSPASAALGRLLLPYLFPELSAFSTVEDLVSHLRATDARYRVAVPTEFLDTNPPPMYITLYFIVTRLPDSLRSVRDHFLSLDPTSLTVDLLEQHLLAPETSAVAVGAARGTPCPPFFEGCSPSPLAPSYASAAAADVSVPEDVGLLLLVPSTAAARARVAGVVEVAVAVVEVAAGVVVGAAVEVVAAVRLLAGVGTLVAVVEAAVGVAAVEVMGLAAAHQREQTQKKGQ